MENGLKAYHLGCPMWANKVWVSKMFTRKAKPKDYLKQYSRVFNAVEGNTTFYSAPRPEIVSRWNADTPDNFHFCFKVPKLISHVYKLRKIESELAGFLTLMDPVLPKMGQLFLQLPPSFNKSGLSHIEAFLKLIPSSITVAVEVRHLDYFNENPAETSLNILLAEYGANKVIFDTTTLHNIKSDNVDIIAAQEKKPKMPVKYLVTGRRPMIRYAGYKNVESNKPYLKKLAAEVSNWIAEGKIPYVFIHSPGGDNEAPAIASCFHKYLIELLGVERVGEMPEWPAHQEQAQSGQLSLFGD